MKIYRQLGIITALLAGCDGSTGPMGEPGVMGAMGAQGPQGPAGMQGTQGIPGPETLTLETDTCMGMGTTPFNCDVECSGVGAIALARGEVEITQPDFGVIAYSTSQQLASDPSTWRFTFTHGGIEGVSTINMSVVCFTPPE